MTDQQQQIEALADALTSERAVRCQEMALLEEKIDKLQRRIEKLEGKERSAVYDPVSGKAVEALTEVAALSKPCVGNRALMQERLSNITVTVDNSELFEEAEKHLKRPGGLLEQLETAQRETEERLVSLASDVEAETAARMAADDALAASIRLLPK